MCGPIEILVLIYEIPGLFDKWDTLSFNVRTRFGRSLMCFFFKYFGELNINYKLSKIIKPISNYAPKNFLINYTGTANR